MISILIKLLVICFVAVCLLTKCLAA